MNFPRTHAEWLERLLAADYSWRGLGEKKLGDAWKRAPDGALVLAPGEKLPQATLQDFWREEEERLVDTPHGQFTRWHLPPGDFGGQRPDAQEVFAKLVTVERLFGTAPDAGGAPSPIPFAGVGFGSAASFLAAAEMLSDRNTVANLSGAFVDAPVTDVDMALRTMPVSGITFLDNVHLKDGMIGDFQASATTFLGDVKLEGISFGKFSARRAIVAKSLWVEGCQFREHFDGEGMAVTEFCNFRSCDFHSGAGFNRCALGFARWRRCSAAAGISIEDTVISGDLETEKNSIGNFNARRLTCQGHLSLDTGDGSEWLSLDRAKVFGKVSFLRPPVIQELSAEKAEFLGGFDLRGLTAGRADFFATVFRGAISFQGATFSGPARFKSASWPTDAADYAAAFREARFTDASDFSTARFTVIAAFHGAYFARPPLIRLDEGKRGERRFREMLMEARAAARASDGPGPFDEEPLEHYYGALEGGARVLKQVMEAGRARGLEQQLYRYELIARRHRPSIGAWERFISRLFGFSSNYGESSLRPLAILVAMTAGLALVYAAWAALLTGSGPGLLPDGLTFSARNVFRPFEVWSSPRSGERDAIETILLWSTNPVWGLLARFVSSLQSFLSLILIFLVALSLKRRFQIG